MEKCKIIKIGAILTAVAAALSAFSFLAVKLIKKKKNTADNYYIECDCENDEAVITEEATAE